MLALATCPVIVFGLIAFTLVRVARRAPARRATVFTLAAVTAVLAAATVYGLGTAATIYHEMEDACRAHHVGEFVHYESTGMPLGGELFCADATIQLVPAWINPAFFLLLAAAVAFTATAILEHRRRSPEVA
jgi:hypothetical protein